MKRSATMMKRSFMGSVLVISLVLQSLHALAQHELERANTQYNLFNYSNAIPLYQKAYKKDTIYYTYYIAERLASCYRLMQDYRNAETWYAIVTAMRFATADDFLRYAQVLQNNSKYAEAKKQYINYYAHSPPIGPTQLNNLLAACDSGVLWMKNPRPFVITNEQSWNGPNSDWGAVKYDNSVVFASDRIRPVIKSHALLRWDVETPVDKKRYLWTGNDYLRLYQAQIGGTDEIKLLAVATDATDYHMGPATFTSDGSEMYFTLTRIPKKQVKDTAAIKTVRLQIFESKKAAATGEWAKPVPFAYNNPKWSVGDPFITPDGKTLYFVSDMPGGKGGTDIYYSKKGANDTWEQPVNLAAVNTKGNERTPVLYKSKLYFSSDDGEGMGGLDVYKAEPKGDSFAKAQNMGYPVNSPRDDFAFMPTSETTGYLSSNRPGGFGSDDIYNYVEKPAPTFVFYGKVFDKQTKQVIANATLTLSNTNGKILTGRSDVTGKFSFTLEEKSNYTVRAEKENYLGDNENLTTLGADPAVFINKNLYLDNLELNKPVVFEHIHSNFDGNDANGAARGELDRLIKMMKDNPGIAVEIDSHTDSRGDEADNMKLSQELAEDVVKYIVETGGIDPKRVKAHGYGATQLLNGCKVGVKCTEAEHQVNRRTEYKVTKM